MPQKYYSQTEKFVFVKHSESTIKYFLDLIFRILKIKWSQEYVTKIFQLIFSRTSLLRYAPCDHLFKYSRRDFSGFSILRLTKFVPVVSTRTKKTEIDVRVCNNPHLERAQQIVLLK